MFSCLKFLILIISTIFFLICACLGFAVYMFGTGIDVFADEVYSSAETEFEVENAELYFTQQPVQDKHIETMSDLILTYAPANDLYKNAARFQGVFNIPEVSESGLKEYQIDDVETFWIMNDDTFETNPIDVELKIIGKYAYYWVEDGLDYNHQELMNLSELFDQHIYPETRKLFGSEWNPGFDHDPKVFIIYTGDIGYSVAGYFSSVDSYHTSINEYSNGHESFYLNADVLYLDDEFTFGVLTHEFQHMIHWNQDRNEEIWLNEGFSELAAFAAGYDPGGFDRLFTNHPDLQLNTWPLEGEYSDSHYGASFLYAVFLAGRFGYDFIHQLVMEQSNGFESIDFILEQNQIEDNDGNQLTADEVFGDWAVANIFDQNNVFDEAYKYTIYPSRPTARYSETINNCTSEWQTRSVNQFGTDYILLDCDEQVDLVFEGSTLTSIVDVNMHSGEYAAWSNAVDESDVSLSRWFDFRDVSGSIELEFWAWYEIESDYDYVYLSVTEDDQNWTLLEPQSGTNYDPNDNNYGNGITGSTGSWVREVIDLSEYAGKEIKIQFDYITDSGLHERGFLVDDIRIDAAGYFTDFESDDGGWQYDGFIRIQDHIPQEFVVSIVEMGDQIEVYRIQLDEEQTFRYSLDFNNASNGIILIVSGVNRKTTIPTAYRFSFE